MNNLLKKYLEYDVLGVAVGCMKRFDENVMEEQVSFFAITTEEIEFA